MLERLLADLAEHHHREQIESHGTAGLQNARGRYSPASTAALDAFWGLDGAALNPIEGGMLDLVIHRDDARQNLSEVADDVRNENLAWMANVGIIRSLESGAVATTEYSAVTNRLAQLQPSISPKVKLSNDEAAEVDTKEAPTRLHPLLASSSVALGAMLLGLRRVRKSVQLRFTGDRSRSINRSTEP